MRHQRADSDIGIYGTPVNDAPASSLPGCSAGLDWNCPFVNFALDEFLQVLRRPSNRCDRFGTIALYPRPYFRSIYRRNDCIVEPLDNSRGCALGGEECKPSFAFEI